MLSSTSIVIFPILILFFLLFTAVPVTVGVFVWRDAFARGMDPLLWTLLAVFAPGFIGLIIYLIMRRDHIKLSCPSCGGDVHDGFISCPVCGQKLAASCVNCGTAVRPEWKLCPQCGTEITATGDFTPPVVSKTSGKGIVAAVIVIIAVPLVLAVTAFSGLVLFRASHSEVNEIYDFTYQMGVEPVCVTSSDSSALTGHHREWIRQKQADKEGIYAMTFSKTETGDYDSDDLKGKYSIVYDYTIIVVNAPDGKEYDNDGLAYEDDSPYLADNVNIYLSDEVNDDEEAIRYGNVFVIRTITKCRVEYNYLSGKKPEVFDNEQDESDRFIVLTLRNKSSGTKASYTIPTGNSDEFFTQFK